MIFISKNIFKLTKALTFRGIFILNCYKHLLKGWVAILVLSYLYSLRFIIDIEIDVYNGLFHALIPNHISDLYLFSLCLNKNYQTSHTYNNVRFNKDISEHNSQSHQIELIRLQLKPSSTNNLKFKSTSIHPQIIKTINKRLRRKNIFKFKR